MDKNELIFIVEDHTNIWDVLKSKSKYISDWGLDTLKGSLGEHVKTIIIEPYYTCKDHRNLYSNFYSKKFKKHEINTERIHFLNVKIENFFDLLTKKENITEYYIGYSVIRPIHERTVGRTIIDQSKIKKGVAEGHFSLSTRYPVNLNGIRFYVNGFPYISQDTEATVCAHSALWGVCRYLSQRYSIYKEIYPYDLVNLTGNTQGRTLPYRGMTYEDYSKILSDFGCYPLIMRVKSSTTANILDANRFVELYSYVESGFPVLASFHGHVVTLIGHTIDYTKDINRSAVFIDSSYFLKQFITVDDNFFPYQLLGYDNDSNNYGRLYSPNPYNINSIATIVCPLPEKAYLPADKARQKMEKFLNLPKVQDLLKQFGATPFITRMFLTSGASFKRKKLEHFLANEDKSIKDEALLTIIDYNLPHFIWVMEIATYSDYKNNGKIIAEILLDATIGYNEYGVLYLRIGNIMFSDGKKKTYVDSVTDFQQYTNNLGVV